MTTATRKGMALAILAATTASAAPAETIFLSTQLRPIEEATAVRQELLKGLDGVDYVVEEPPQFAVRMAAEAEAGKHTISLVGATHGELAPLADRNMLTPLDDIAAALKDKGITPALMDLGKLGHDHQQYIPWMQATYVMVAKQEALEFLPEGADLNALTYEQLIAWGKAMQEETGQARIGFPAGPKGLFSRFFQGYLYPSYTGGVVRTFKSPEDVAGWEMMKSLWAVTNPSSTNYGFMQEPLLADEVWVAWDHVARLKEAVISMPDQVKVFPAPAGPKGRGYMPVVAGLAIPQGAPDVAGAEKVIAHLVTPEVQLMTAEKVGFFPTLSVPLPEGGDPGIAAMAAAVTATQTASDGVVSLLPVGLGDKGGEFNKIYTDTFQRIVLNGEDIQTVLEAEAKVLSGLMETTKAPCWAPDAKSDGPCPVE